MADSPPLDEQLLDAQDVSNTVHRLAFQILERHPRLDIAFLGIHKRGVVLAKRVATVLQKESGRDDASGLSIPIGFLDTSFHRDDLDQLKQLPVIEPTDIPFDLEGAVVILFDDVIFTGRTIRSAIECLMGFGRPAKIELAVFIDRGNRELPIQPDYKGVADPIEAGKYVSVRFKETDGQDGIFLGAKKKGDSS